MYEDLQPIRGQEKDHAVNLNANCLDFEPVIADKKPCQFFLLGPFMIMDNKGRVVTPKAQKTCAMLAMLILSPRATRTRVWLRDKLWSDRGEEQGAASLRQALLDARRSLKSINAEIIISDKKSISLNIDNILLDTELFFHSEDQFEGQHYSLKRAVHEDLLEGMDIRDPEFEDWLALERQIWERRVSEEIEGLALNTRINPAEKSERGGDLSTESGQKIMTTIVAIQFESKKSTDKQVASFFDECVAKVRDISIDSGGRIYEVERSHVMMEFERPIDAVHFAVGLKQHMRDSLQQDSKLMIGINSGLVYRQNNLIFGTESDIALAASHGTKSGNIMITEATCALIQGKTDLQFVFDQEFEIDGLPKPVQLFRIEENAIQPGSDNHVFNSRKAVEKNDVNGPSIGVLPFRTVDSSTHDYMGEGLADDIIVALSKNHWLNVISRNSSFAYQVGTMSSSTIANNLNVNYIVNGMLRVSNSVITIEVTLESASSNQIIWSEPFSVQLADIMQLQELVASKITAHLIQELGKYEQVKAYESRIDDLTTWQLVHRGHWHMTRRTSTGVKRAKNLYERALKRDPFQSDALVALAWWYFWKAWLEHGDKNTNDDLLESKRFCRKALLMDASDGRVYAYLGAIAIMQNDASASLGSFNEAIRLNSSLSFAYSSRGSANLLLASPESAPADIKNALALNPADYYRFHSLAELASAYFFSGDIEESIRAAEKSTFLAPRYWYARLIKIACLIQRNAKGDAARAAQEKAEIISRKVNVCENNIRAIPFVDRGYNKILLDAYKEV